MTNKFALTIRTDDAPWTMAPHSLKPEHLGMAPLPDEFFHTIVHLANRATCETDESMLQLLPYMTLRHKGKVFVYARGRQGGEGRLHGLLSIGIGGHVDCNPDVGEHLLSLLQREAAREYKEEVGTTIPHKAIFTHYIFDPETPVGRVHLGLHCIVEVEDCDFATEVGVIEKGTWMEPTELMSTDIYSALEPWSRTAISQMFYRG